MTPEREAEIRSLIERPTETGALEDKNIIRELLALIDQLRASTAAAAIEAEKRGVVCGLEWTHHCLNAANPSEYRRVLADVIVNAKHAARLQQR